MSEDRQEKPTRKSDRTQRLTGLLIVGVVIMAAVSLLAGLNKKLFGPEEGPFQESETVVTMEVETPVPDEAGDASRPGDDVADANSLNAPIPAEVTAVVGAAEGEGADAVEVDEVVAEPVASKPLNVPSTLPETASAEKPSPEPAASPAATKPASKPAEKSAVKPVAPQSPVQKSASRPEKYLGRVTDLDFNSDFSSFTMSVKTSAPVDQVTWFPVKSPRKVAIDIRGAWKPGVKPLHRFDEGVVDKVIVGRHPDRIRIVLWLRNSEGKKIGEPKIEKTSNGVNVTISD